MQPGCPHLRDWVTIHLRTGRKAPIHQVLLRTCPDSEQQYTPWYQSLIRVRRSSRALMEGGFPVQLVEPDTLVFQRDAEDEIAIVVAHGGEQVSTPLQPSPWPTVAYPMASSS